jgi:hypothetical protein
MGGKWSIGPGGHGRFQNIARPSKLVIWFIAVFAHPGTLEQAIRYNELPNTRNIVYCTQLVHRSLRKIRSWINKSSVTCIYSQVANILRCHFLRPFSVSTQTEYVCFTSGSQSRGGCFSHELLKSYELVGFEKHSGKPKRRTHSD